MRQGLNKINQPSYEVMEMCTYFVKINIMICVLNHSNCKMIQISQPHYIQKFDKEKDVGQTLWW